MGWERILPRIPFIVEGMGITLKFTAVALVCGLLLATLLAAARLSSSRVLRVLAGAYVSVFRGTPLLVQLVLVFFALPQLLGIRISPFMAGALAFSLNSAAYSSEIIRAGIQSVERGQREAAKVLGLSPLQTYICVILPQAIRNVLPSLVNEAIDLLKESALVSVVGEWDILRRAQIVSSETYLYFEPLLVATLCYYVLVFALTLLARFIERRLSYA